MIKLWLILAIVAVAALGVASFAPLPGYCNVSVSVTNNELSLGVGTAFSVSSVSGTTTGKATVLDWGGWLPGGFAWASLTGSFQEKVTVGPATTTKSETQLTPSIPFLNGAQFQAQDTYNLAYVPVGSQPIGVTLTENGQTVATGSSTLSVGC